MPTVNANGVALGVESFGADDAGHWTDALEPHGHDAIEARVRDAFERWVRTPATSSVSTANKSRTTGSFACGGR